MIRKIVKNRLAYIAPFLIFLFFSGWWLYLKTLDLDFTRAQRQIWGATYQILAIYGGIIGLLISKKWGGYRSLIGKIILAFSIGLFLQSFGQTYSSYYVYFYSVEAPPYPAIGDIGFFGSVVAYIYGVILLSRISGVGVSLKKIHNKALICTVPCLFILFSYIFFLKNYEFDWSIPLKVVLDFGYPFGQALYVSIAASALFMSRNILGGMMKKPILFLIFALIFQYFSDFMFLYQASAGNWYVGNINDFLYCTSYFIMLISLIQLGRAFDHIKNA
jgi:hypothetical protein